MDEQDAQVDAFMDGAKRVIYGGSTGSGQLSASVSEMLRGTREDPVGTLGGTAAEIASTVVTSAQEAGQQLDGKGVVLPGTWALVNELAGISRAEGIYDYSDQETQAAINASSEQVYNLTSEMGIWNKDELMQDMDGLMAADQDGSLESFITQAEQASMPQGGGGGV